MTMGIIRSTLAGTLLNFARTIDPNTTIDAAYCYDMAWGGTVDSKAYKNLPESEKLRLATIIEGERGNEVVSPDYPQKGMPCQ